MEPQQNTPPGWYPDPAGGPHYRHWDGMRWTPATGPATPSTRRRRRMGVIATLAAVAAVLIVAVVVFVESALGPSLGELTDAADKLRLPPGLTLVDETATGNRMCLEECVRLSRVYTSPSPAEATLKIVVTALEKAGYRCIIPSVSSVNRDWCVNFEVEFLSYWQRGTDRFTISIDVNPIPSTGASLELPDIPVDPAWQSSVGVSIPEYH
jgi:hypothetical protein